MDFDERDVLLKAASGVEQAWTQGAFNDGDSSCALGWLERATNQLIPPGTGQRVMLYHAAVRALANQLDRKGAHGFLEGLPEMASAVAGGSIIGWNDSPDMTATEVAEAMRAAAWNINKGESRE